MRLTIPKLRTWHLMGIVAASAAYLWALPLRWSAQDPAYALVRQLHSRDFAERRRAVVAIGQLERAERRGIAPLTEALFDADVGVRRDAARVLAWVLRSGGDEVGMVKAALASALGDRDPETRLQVARSLFDLGVEPRVVVPTLLKFASGTDAKGRAEGVALLGRFARVSEPALAALFAALGDADAGVRSRAVESLGFCSWWPNVAPEPLRGRIGAALVAATDDENWGVRAWAVRGLGTLAARLRVDHPRVIEALGDPEWRVRHEAVNSLNWGRPGQRSAALVPALVRGLADSDQWTRRVSAEILGTLGLDAEAALGPLRELVGDPDQGVCDPANVALVAIEKAIREFRDVTLPRAIAELDDADPIVRALAADRLESFGPRAGEAVPALVRCLGDREADVRRASAKAFGKIGPAAVVAVADLARLAESDPDERVRLAAASSRSILARDEGGDHAP